MHRPSTQRLLLGILALSWLASAIAETTVTAAVTRARPYFDPAMPTDVYVQLGATLRLPCVVRQRGDYLMRWDLNGDLVWPRRFRKVFVIHNVDQRFELDDDDTTLTIKYAALRDAGTITCTVKTDGTDQIRWVFHLNVIVPKAEITEAPVIHFKAGNSLNLTCVVWSCMDVPLLIRWYNGDELVKDVHQPVIATRQARLRDRTIHTITLIKATPSDSGNYTCRSPITDPASVEVHVLDGESNTELTKEPTPTIPSPQPTPECEEDSAELKMMMRNLFQEMKELKSELRAIKSSVNWTARNPSEERKSAVDTVLVPPEQK